MTSLNPDWPTPQATRLFEGTPAGTAADVLIDSLTEDYHTLEAAFGPQNATFVDGSIKSLLWAHGSFYSGSFEVPGSPALHQVGDWRGNTELLGLTGTVFDDNLNDSVEVHILARHEGTSDLQRYREKLLEEALEMPPWKLVHGRALIHVGPFRVYRAAAMAAKLSYLPPEARCGGIPPCMLECLSILQVGGA